MRIAFTIAAGFVVLGLALGKDCSIACAADEPGFILAHKTLYVAPAIAEAHRFELSGVIKDAEGAGTIVLDGNSCQLNAFGDRTVCAAVVFHPVKVKFSRLRLADPAGQDREVFSISGADLPKATTFTLVIGRKSKPMVQRLVVESAGQSTAFPLVPQNEYDKAPKAP